MNNNKNDAHLLELTDRQLGKPHLYGYID